MKHMLFIVYMISVYTIERLAEATKCGTRSSFSFYSDINDGKHMHHGFLAPRPYLCRTSLTGFESTSKSDETGRSLLFLDLLFSDSQYGLWSLPNRTATNDCVLFHVFCKACRSCHNFFPPASAGGGYKICPVCLSVRYCSHGRTAWRTVQRF